MPVKKKPVKIDSSLVNWDSYAAILRGFVPNLYNNLPMTTPKEYLDSLIDTLSNKMYIAAKHCQYHKDHPFQNTVSGTEEEIKVTTNANNTRQSFLRGEIPCDT